MLTVHDDKAILAVISAMSLLHNDGTHEMRRDGFRSGSVGNVFGNVLDVIPERFPLCFAIPSVGALELRDDVFSVGLQHIGEWSHVTSWWIRSPRSTVTTRLGLIAGTQRFIPASLLIGS